MMLKPDIPDLRDYLCKSNPTTARRIDNRRWISSVENQSYTSSCAPHAGTTICESLEAVNGVSKGDLSRLDLYHWSRILSGLRDRDGGVYLRDVCKALTDYGVAQETDWPFDPRKVMDTPPDLPRKKCTKYSRIDVKDWPTMESMMARGYNLLIGAHIYEGIYSIRGRLESHAAQFANYTTNKSYGGHAMVLCGYDYDLRGRILANSWGKEYGDAGTFLMPDAIFERDVFDVWAIEEFNGLSMPDITTAPDALSLSGDVELVVWRTFSTLNNIPKTLRLKCTGGYLPYKYEVTNLPPWLTILEQSGGVITLAFKWAQNERLDGKFLVTVSDARGQVDQMEIHAVGFESFRVFDQERAKVIKEYLTQYLCDWKKRESDYQCIPNEVDAAMSWSEGTFDRITTGLIAKSAAIMSAPSDNGETGSSATANQSINSP
jgi:hypothetical protein